MYEPNTKLIVFLAEKKSHWYVSIVRSYVYQPFGARIFFLILAHPVYKM